MCYGPRCGGYPGHRAIARALEQGATLPVQPMLCQGICGPGVTVAQPDGTRVSVIAPRDANDLLKKAVPDAVKPPHSH